MKKLLSLFCFLFLTSGFLLLPGMVRADVFMKSKHHSDAFQMMGRTQPAKDFIKTVWMGQDKVRHDFENKSMIIRLDKKVMYILDHAKKSYTEVPLDPDQAFGPDQGEQSTRKGPKGPAKGMPPGMGEMKVTVTETGETRKINNWHCRKYLEKIDFQAGPADTVVWATEDLKMNYDLLANAAAAMKLMQPGGRESARQMTRELKKIRGVPVLTISTSEMMGARVKSSEELIEFKEERAPAGIYEVPKGYREQGM